MVWAPNEDGQQQEAWTSTGVVQELGGRKAEEGQGQNVKMVRK